jgi:hypothetical protein
MIKSLLPRLAEIGKLKIGCKGQKRLSKQGKEYRLPQKLDHFVATKLTKDKSDNFITDEVIMGKIGKNCREIDMILCYDSIEKDFLNSLALYAGRKCICRGDGETAIQQQKIPDGKGGFKKDKKGYDLREPKEVKCAEDGCLFLVNKQCKPNGILSMILPDSGYIGGVHKIRTTSWNSIRNILSSLSVIASQTGGKLAGIPLKLQIIKMPTEEHGEIDVLNVAFKGDRKALQNEVKQLIEYRLKNGIDMNKIELLAEKTGVLGDNDEPSDVEDEFYFEDKKSDNKSKSMDISADSFATSGKDLIDVEKIEEEVVVEKEKEKDKGLDEVL